MSNQASEDELRTVVSDMLTNLMIKSSLQKLDKHTDIITSGRKYIAMHNEELNTILDLIRTEKLKAQTAILQEGISESKEFCGEDVDINLGWVSFKLNELQQSLTKMEAEL